MTLKLQQQQHFQLDAVVVKFVVVAAAAAAVVGDDDDDGDSSNHDQINGANVDNFCGSPLRRLPPLRKD